MPFFDTILKAIARDIARYESAGWKRNFALDVTLTFPLLYILYDGETVTDEVIERSAVVTTWCGTRIGRTRRSIAGRTATCTLSQ